MAGDPGSTERRFRVGARDGLAIQTDARTKPRGAARPPQLTAVEPGETTDFYEIERSLAGDKDSLRSARIDLARRLRSQEAEFQEAIFTHVRSVAPDAVADGDSHLALGLREMIAVCMDYGLASIEQGALWSGPMPPAVAAHASRAASGGVSLTTALCRCVAGHTLAWSFVLDEVAHHDLPDELRFALLLQTSVVLGSLLAGVQTEIADAHSSEIRRRARSREQRQAEIVHKLLAGEPVDAAELTELEYELDAWHLAVIGTGAEAAEAARSLAAGLHRELLVVAYGGKTVWAWLGGQSRPGFADVERVFSAQEHADVSLAVGEPARGLRGWRVTQQEAEGALLVARYRPRRLMRYRDVALEATALQNEALTDSLIETYLSPLDNHRCPGATLRETLRAYFAAGHNASAAARALYVSPRTMRNRMTLIEDGLGSLLYERHAELELALRLDALRKDAPAPS